MGLTYAKLLHIHIYMETVFDYNPTEEELKALFGGPAEAEEARRRYEQAGDLGGPDPEIIYLLIIRERWDEAEAYTRKFDREMATGTLLPDIAKARQGAEVGQPLV